MGESKFYRKTSELKRTLVLSGIALASFVVPGTLKAEENGTQQDPPGGNLNVDSVDGPDGAEIKTQEILAGVTRGGFGNAYDDDVIDPLSPWGPSAPLPNIDTDENVYYYPPAYYGGVWYIGGYIRPVGYAGERCYNRHGGHGVGG